MVRNPASDIGSLRRLAAPGEDCNVSNPEWRQMVRGALKAIEIYEKALNKSAAWQDGAVVNSSFDSPGDATLAREALAAAKQDQEV